MLPLPAGRPCLSQRERRLGEDQWQPAYGDGQRSTMPSGAIAVNYPHNNYDDFIAHSWLAEPSSSWNGVYSSQDDAYHWQHQQSIPIVDDTLPPSSFYHPGPQHLSFNNNANDGLLNNDIHYVKNEEAYPSCSPLINRLPFQDGNNCHSQTPPALFQSQHQLRYANSTDPLILPERSRLSTNAAEFIQELPGDACLSSLPRRPSRGSNVSSASIPELTSPTDSSVGFQLDWSISTQPSLPRTSPATFTTVDYLAPAESGPKRKCSSPDPTAAARSNYLADNDALMEGIFVFENAPGALASVKRRRKLEAPVRKAARAVREAGACHQCRFRKRTCSTGTPCGSCIKNGQGLHELKCQRESPFTGKTWHEYFEFSSQRRCVDFEIILAPKSATNKSESITIDGIGGVSHPIRIVAQRKIIGQLKFAQKTSLKKAEDPCAHRLGSDDDMAVMILEDDDILETKVEQWAIEYASKFVHAAGPRFESTTAPITLGTAYVQKKLPESELVAAMLRVASISFVLRAGVKYTTSASAGPKVSPRYRTVQATIDTILYRRLQLAEKDLFKMLQRIVFRSLGYLNRQQIYPVALVFWQLLRMLCLGTSHLANIVQKFNTQASTQSAQISHSLALLLSTHLALFRSSSPLLLDFSYPSSSSSSPPSTTSSSLTPATPSAPTAKAPPAPATKAKQNRADASITKPSRELDQNHNFGAKVNPNHDLLSHDPQLIELAIRMKNVVQLFREKGFPDMKGSIAYRKKDFEGFRKVYDGF